MTGERWRGADIATAAAAPRTADGIERALRMRVAEIERQQADLAAELETLARALAPFDSAAWQERRERAAADRREAMERQHAERVAEHHGAGHVLADGTAHDPDPDGCRLCARLLSRED